MYSAANNFISNEIGKKGIVTIIFDKKANCISNFEIVFIVKRGLISAYILQMKFNIILVILKISCNKFSITVITLLYKKYILIFVVLYVFIISLGDFIITFLRRK